MPQVPCHPKSCFIPNPPALPQVPLCHKSPSFTTIPPLPFQSLQDTAAAPAQLVSDAQAVVHQVLESSNASTKIQASLWLLPCTCSSVFGGQPSEIHRMPQKVPRTDREPWLRLARCFIICHCDRAPDGHHHWGLEHLLQCRGVEGQRPDCFPASPQAAAAHLTNPLTFSSCPSVQCPMEWNIPLVSGWKVSSLIPSVAWCHKETEQSVITHSIQDTGPKVQRSLQR